MFVKFLEKLTGIENLIADPHYRGSGIHQTLPGGFLNIHADFNRYIKYDMHRRVNLLLYMNPNWTESYGGHLELWSRDLQRCEQRILPTLGTVLLVCALRLELLRKIRIQALCSFIIFVIG